MDSIGTRMRLLKWSVGAIGTALFGIILILQGNLQSIVTGCGAILASIVVLLLVRWELKHGDGSPDEEATELANNPKRLVWVGIGLTIAPGVVYLYLRYAMTRYDPNAVIFISVLLLIAGLGCLGLGLWKTMQRSQNK